MAERPAETDVAGRYLAQVLGAALSALYLYRALALYFLVDDAYISFRYARNLIRGAGLVWNEGERVEGYSNFLWVLLVSAAMRAGLSPESASCGLGIASGLATLWLAAAYGAHKLGSRSPSVWAASAVLVAIRPFAAWATSGLETMLFTLLVNAGLLAWLVERSLLRAPVASGLLLALATLTRPDGGLFLALALAALLAEAIYDGTSPRAAAKTVALFLMPSSLLVFHEIFRVWYYGDIVPNTFHVKVDEPRFQRGAAYLALFHASTALGFVVPPVLLYALRYPSRERLLLSAAVLAQCLYVARLGGDPGEFRMLVPVLPAAAILIAGVIPRGLAGILLTLSVLGLLLTWPVTTGRLPRGELATIETMRTYTGARLRQGRALRALVDAGQLPADLHVAAGGAGAMPYVLDLRATDVLGLNDREVARSAPIPGARIGHERLATKEHLRDRGVDMLEVSSGIFFSSHSPSEAALATARRRLNVFQRGSSEVTLSLRCLRVPGGHLLFASPLPEERFDERFGHLVSCRPAR